MLVFASLLTVLSGCGVSTKQAEQNLANMGFVLMDKFEVIDSDWTAAPGDMVQTFKLKLSRKDTKALTKVIELKPNFMNYGLNDAAQSVFDQSSDGHSRVVTYRQGAIYYHGLYSDGDSTGYEMTEIYLNSETGILDFSYVDD